LKIAFFSDTYYPQLNGVTISLDNLAKELLKKGHTVYIFAPKIKAFKDKNKNIIRIPSFKVLSSEPEVLIPIPSSYRNYAKAFRLKFDLVHAHGNGAYSLLGYQVARMKQVPFILTFHTFHTKYTHYFLNGKIIKPRMVATALRLFANVCDSIIAPSEKMKKELSLYGVKKNIVIIPNFVDLDYFQKQARGFLHKKFKIPSKDKILLTVGRLGKEKNFQFTVNVLSKIIKKYNYCHLVIVGQGPEKDSLQELVRKYGIEKNVHFANKLDSSYMPSVYADGDIFVFASDSEVHPMVALEAGASGLPMVVVKDSAFSNIVIDGFNGFVCKLQEKIFVEKIEQLLENPKLMKEFGKKSRKIIAENFSPQLITNDLTDHYAKVISVYKSNPKKT